MDFLKAALLTTAFFFASCTIDFKGSISCESSADCVGDYVCNNGLCAKRQTLMPVCETCNVTAACAQNAPEGEAVVCAQLAWETTGRCRISSSNCATQAGPGPSAFCACADEIAERGDPCGINVGKFCTGGDVCDRISADRFSYETCHETCTVGVSSCQKGVCRGLPDGGGLCSI